MAVDYMMSNEDFRTTVAVMRELGVVQAFGIVLGPEPRVPLAVVKELAELTPAERRAQRIEDAREAVRAKLGDWDMADEKCDKLIDPSVFDE